MKKNVCLLLLTLLLMLGACGICESPLSGHAQTIFDAIRWNVNLPKQSTLVHAEEEISAVNAALTDAFIR